MSDPLVTVAETVSQTALAAGDSGSLLSWVMNHGYLLVGLLLPIVIPLALFQILPLLVLIERRGAAMIQDRPGPYRAGLNITAKDLLTFNLAGIMGSKADPGALRLRAFGMIFNLTDAVKLLFKEHLTPPFVHKGYYIVAPMIPLLCGLLTPALIPFFAPISYVAADGSIATLMGQTINANSGILLLFALGSLSVYGIVLGSWASNSKYSLLGGMRASAMMISYEVSMGLAVMGMLLIVGSLSLTDVVTWQGTHTWGIIVQPLGFVLFLVSMFAECNRNPFDVAEGESEIVAGFHTEYNGVKFMLFMSAEYLHMIVASILLATLFCGGYQLLPCPVPLNGVYEPWVALDTTWVKSHLNWVAGAGLIGGGVLFAMLALIVRGKRRGQAARVAKFHPSDAGLIQRELGFYGLLFAGGALAKIVAGIAAILLIPQVVPQIIHGVAIWPGWVDAVTAFVQFNIVIVKSLFFCWLFVWVRWTLPRFRYDQIMGLGWKVMLNLALVNLLVTAIVAKLVS